MKPESMRPRGFWGRGGWALLTVMTLAAALTVAACCSKQDAFVGKRSGGAYPMPGQKYPETLTLAKDGTCSLDSAHGHWHAEGNAVVLEASGTGKGSRLLIEAESGLLTDGYKNGLSFEPAH